MLLPNPAVEAGAVRIFRHQHAGLVTPGVQAALVEFADRRVLFQHLPAEGYDVVEIEPAGGISCGGNSHSAVSFVCSGPSGSNLTVRT